MQYALNRKKYFIRLAPVTLFLLFSPVAFTQDSESNDTIIRVSKGSFVQIREIKSFVQKDTLINIPPNLISEQAATRSRTISFYDSLKTKACKTKFTKILYDLVIVPPEFAKPKSLGNRSDEYFREYSGYTIRDISVTRLDVFGTSIENPGLYDPKNIQGLLNKTHIRSREGIIRNYLLFGKGDTISPLRLTDNERILRQLPYVDDARILVVPVSENEADIMVITKDVYSLGGELKLSSKERGSFWLFEKNLMGIGHELKMEIPFSADNPDSPGIGLNYFVKNINKSFLNLNFNYYNALGRETFGANLTRELVSSETRYAGGISFISMLTTEDLDTLPEPVPLKYTYQDYWILRAFLLDRNSVTRLILGARFINNNVYKKPVIGADEYYRLQKYKSLLGSVALSTQEYYKANLIYSYGRNEDIPAGSLLRITGGFEKNEFKTRSYAGADLSAGTQLRNAGYLYLSAGFGTYFNKSVSEQGLLSLRSEYFTSLVPVGSTMIRNFIRLYYTRGIARYDDEFLKIPRENGFSGFKNDSVRGSQRLNLSLESVIFAPRDLIGFRFAVFGFADLDVIAGAHEALSKGTTLSSIGIGCRIRNDNLIFNTLQVRFAYFPVIPDYSRIRNTRISGEQLLRPENFDPGPPSVYIYR